MKRIFFILVLCVCLGQAAKSQSLRNMFGVSWEVSVPSNTEFISKVSWAGGKVEYRHFIKDNISLGTTLSWNNYEEYRPRKTYENADQTYAITTDNQRFVFNLPMTVDGFYYLKNTGHFTPYAGIGLGAQYSSQEVYYNIYLTDNKNWGFVMRPQIGTLINFNPTNPTRLILAAGYNYATNKNESFKIDNQQSFWVSLGIGWGN